MAKIPYMLIIGEKEKADGTVTVRMRDGKNLPPMSIDEFAEKNSRGMPGRSWYLRN